MALERRFRSALARADLRPRTGRVLDFDGLVIQANGPDVFLGELCEVHPRSERGAAILAEVVGFREGRVLLMPYGDVHGIALESEVVAKGHPLTVPVGDALLGRVVDAFCRPLDGGAPLALTDHLPVYRAPINPLARDPADELLETGIRCIDGLLTLSRGQRVGVFAGSGVGKSTVLGMLARHVRADVNVIALVGERGREVWDFVRDALGAEGLRRSVVVVATADAPALVRVLAVHAATAIAESFRDRGRHVFMITDSITRLAMAQREVGLAVGEPPASRGYTPSVFSLLPKIVERGGRLSGAGSITSVFSVLVEGDDMNEPVADHMRALLDGHIVLSRDIAARGQYPAIDVLQSVSRLMGKVASPQARELAQRVRAALARHDASRDLIEMGAYRQGSNPELDQVLRVMPALRRVLEQPIEQAVPRDEALASFAAALEGALR